MLWSVRKQCIFPECICGWSIKPVLSEEQYVLSRYRKTLICLWFFFLNSAPGFHLCFAVDSTYHSNTSRRAEPCWSFQGDACTHKTLPLALFIPRITGSGASSCPALTVTPSSPNGGGDWGTISSTKQLALIPPAAQLVGIYVLPEVRLREGHLQKTRSLSARSWAPVQHRMQTEFL